MYTSSTHPRDDATTTGCGDRHALPARLGRDGQRRVRVGALGTSSYVFKAGTPTESWSAQEAVETRAICEARTEVLIKQLVQPRSSGSLHNYDRTGDREGVTTMYQSRKGQASQTSDFR